MGRWSRLRRRRAEAARLKREQEELEKKKAEETAARTVDGALEDAVRNAREPAMLPDAPKAPAATPPSLDLGAISSMPPNPSSYIPPSLQGVSPPPQSLMGVPQNLWTDAASGSVYTRNPFCFNQDSPGAVTNNGVRGASTIVFEYMVPPSLALHFIPNYSPHYIMGRFHGPDGKNLEGGYGCGLYVESCLGGLRIRIWTGTTDDINSSQAMRESGHPLHYTGESSSELLAQGGDRILLIVDCPKAEDKPLPSKDLEISLRCFGLSKVNVG